MDRVRMDKWLWAARFFKTRVLAARACELGRIESNGQQAKAAREVRAGDLLQVKNDSGDFQVEVVLLSDMRGPAAVAQTLYRETEASRELRLKLAEERKAMSHFDAPREGKPSKRNRRNSTGCGAGRDYLARRGPIAATIQRSNRQGGSRDHSFHQGAPFCGRLLRSVPHYSFKYQGMVMVVMRWLPFRRSRASSPGRAGCEGSSDTTCARLIRDNDGDFAVRVPGAEIKNVIDYRNDDITKRRSEANQLRER